MALPSSLRIENENTQRAASLCSLCHRFQVGLKNCRMYLQALLINYLLCSSSMQIEPSCFIFHQCHLCYFSSRAWFRSPASHFKPSGRLCLSCAAERVLAAALSVKRMDALRVVLLQKAELTPFPVDRGGISSMSLLQGEQPG